MEWLARLTAISFWKELRSWDRRIVSFRCRWLVDRNPFGCSAMSHRIPRCCWHFLQLGVDTCHPGHVVVVVSPVDWNWDILLGIQPRLAHWLDHYLIHLVACDSHDFTLEAFHDLGRQWLISLISPKHFTIVSGNLRSPHVKEFVALRSVVVVKIDVLAAGNLQFNRCKAWKVLET